MSRDYKKTVFLPRTDFPMRGDLAKREPEILKRWAEIDLYKILRQDAAERPPYVLHDGPPYANGHLHIGHALNKILKDVINRAQQMSGKNADYVPGWDCHGLPIEWKVEEEIRAAGKTKNDFTPGEIRRRCRTFAEGWIDIQRTEFKRLGVIGDWENPYKTMNFAAEATIFQEFAQILESGGVYQGVKPTLWSVVEQTALADAEVEYEDHVSTAIHVRFPIVAPSQPALNGAAAVIWTTTPWTIPGNRAIAYNPEMDYVVLQVTERAEGAVATPGDKLLVAAALADAVCKAAKITCEEVARFKGAALEGSIAAHPLRGDGYEFDVPLLPGDHVTEDAGTGLVHTAPGHGLEDFDVGRRFGLEVPQTVGGDGIYYAHVPLFAGLHVFKADGPVTEALTAAGALLDKTKLKHSYPHSWRSKAPLIYRTTPQWFISMESTGLRGKALAAIDATRWLPAQGKNRIQAMIEQRPDWCVSRQRVWGVPLAVFLKKSDGQPLIDAGVNARIAAAFAAEGGDAWFDSPAERFLGPDYKVEEFEQIKDVLEVWFDSGSSHAFVLETRAAGTPAQLRWPADLYLEGSDQHRGWFHTSLLESCATRGRAPYDAVLTHGFVLDEQGRKMSKSLGNVVSPQEVANDLGVDILRLWVVSSDYSDDLRIGKEILKRQTDLYRRLRNTLRYLLGALDGWTDAEAVDFADMPELERWILHRVAELDKVLAEGIAAYDFHTPYMAIHHFCSTELSALYFDIRKDSLYCDAPSDPRRRAVRSVMRILLDRLCVWLAPVLCFTAEEAWTYRPGGGQDPTDSVHRQLLPAAPAEWLNPALAQKWERIRELRRVVTGAIELKRAEKVVGSSLEAAPTLYLDAADTALLEGLDFADICIASALSLAPIAAAPADAFRLAEPGLEQVAVSFAKIDTPRCERCWKRLPEVGSLSDPHLCGRCLDAAGDAA